jgi:SAM-dependent MidA family methyltransferase
MTGATGISTLPALGPDESRQSAVVLQALRARIIERGGWLPFDEYLRLVLYEPGLGYYSAGSVKLGRAGDFVTAPELSPLFGRALARQCAQALDVLDGGVVLELGAGSGALAAALLPAMQELGSLPEHYEILETSADLVARQRERLDRLPEPLRARLHWRERLPDSPISGVILANEVADALPFRRFLVSGQGFLERGVALTDRAALTVSDRAADAQLAAELERLAPTPWPIGYESELCPLLDGWVAALGAALAHGVALLIDYGLARHEYYHPQRMHGTLRCYFRHRAHEDALLYPGLQDISAWVDFTRAAEAATACGLTVSGYCTQAAFLLANGIEADVAAAGTTIERAQLAAQARHLLLPGEMGESCKVIALTRDLDAPLRGFSYQDLRRAL